MAWRIEFDAGALKDLRGLDRQIARRITQFLRERLGTMDDPRGLGAALRSPRSGPGATPLWRSQAVFGCFGTSFPATGGDFSRQGRAPR